MYKWAYYNYKKYITRVSRNKFAHQSESSFQIHCIQAYDHFRSIVMNSDSAFALHLTLFACFLLWCCINPPIFVILTGLCPSDKTLQDMVKEAPGQLNFTMFLSLFSEKLSGKWVTSAASGEAM